MRLGFSTKGLFLLVAFAAVFCAGWIIPSPIERPEWEPVLVANDDLDPYSRLSKYDVRLEHRLASTIPPDAARNISDVDGWRLANGIQKHDFILLDDFSDGLISVSVPPNHSVVNIRVDGEENQLLLSLLKRGDKVSVNRLFESERSRSVIDCVRIFNCGSRTSPKHQGIAGLLVTDDQKQAIIKSRQEDGAFILGLPRNGTITKR